MHACMDGWMDGCVRACVYVCTYVCNKDLGYRYVLIYASSYLQSFA